MGLRPADVRHVAELRELIRQGGSPRFVLFWSHQPAGAGLGPECLSQWYRAAFDVEGQRYPTAEHYLMAEKARLFGDHAARDRILAASHPGEAKRLGRQVAGYDEAVWRQHRCDVVMCGNLAKFGQPDSLRAFLLATGDRVLVEASPRDAVWGSGLAADTAGIRDPLNWPGLNLLGFALMEVRSRLAAAPVTEEASGRAPGRRRQTR